MTATNPAYRMTPALRDELLAGIAGEGWSVEERAELSRLVRAHDTGDALAFELVDTVEYFGVAHLAVSS